MSFPEDGFWNPLEGDPINNGTNGTLNDWSSNWIPAYAGMTTPAIETIHTLSHNESMPDTPRVEKKAEKIVTGNDNPLLDKAIKANERRKMLGDIFTSTIMKVVATVFLLSTLFSAAFLIAYQQVQKQNYDRTVKEIPDARVVIPNLVDYANQKDEWKTYTNEKYKFTLQYPASYKTPDIQENGYIGEKIYFAVYEKDVTTCRGDCNGIDKTENVTIGGLPALRIEGDQGSVGGNIPQEYLTYQIKKDKQYYTFTLYSIGIDEDVESIEDIKKLKEDDIKIFDHILSTLKFTDSPTLTTTPKGKFCGGIAAIACPSGYSCKLDGSYPDAGGTCVVNSTSIGNCKPTGCSGQICSDKDEVSTCEFKEEYACYQSAKCERQTDGKCGWTQTNELKACVESKN